MLFPLCFPLPFSLRAFSIFCLSVVSPLCYLEEICHLHVFRLLIWHFYRETCRHIRLLSFSHPLLPEIWNIDISAMRLPLVLCHTTLCLVLIFFLPCLVFRNPLLDGNLFPPLMVHLQMPVLCPNVQMKIWEEIV